MSAYEVREMLFTLFFVSFTAVCIFILTQVVKKEGSDWFKKPANKVRVVIAIISVILVGAGAAININELMQSFNS